MGFPVNDFMKTIQLQETRTHSKTSSACHPERSEQVGRDAAVVCGNGLGRKETVEINGDSSLRSE
jgi:hypothetical protein